MIFKEVRILDIERIAACDIYAITLDAALSPAAGQFLTVSCGEGTTLLRPFGVFDAGEDFVRFGFEVRGKGTTLLKQKRAGDTLKLLGPLGKGFTLPETGKALLVGGGIGVFPLYYTAKVASQKGGCDALLGFRSKDFVHTLPQFEAVCGHVSVCTDDGSFARKALVTELLEEALQKGGYESVHICGPLPMMRACADITKRYGIKTEVSMEERMGCGIGACYACVCKVLSSDGQTYKRVCKDGPVFDAEAIVW